MTNLAFYSDRKDELNEILNLILDFKQRIIIYQTCPGYGITAFFHRVQWALQSTPNYLCFNAELSLNQGSPIDEILKSISIRNDSLYHSLQLYADNSYGEYEETLVESIVKDLPYFGETLSTIFSSQKALPIYSGYYPDILKELFSVLLSDVFMDKKIVIFIDGIEYINNSAIYDVINLSKLTNVFLVLSCNESAASNKLCLELEIRHNVKHKIFMSPSIECVQELGEAYSKTLSKFEAQQIKIESNDNIRKIILNIKNEQKQNIVKFDNLCECICSLLLIIDDEIELDDLIKLLSLIPITKIYEEYAILSAIKNLTDMGLITHVIALDKKGSFIRKKDNNNELWKKINTKYSDIILYKDAIYNLFKNKVHLSLHQLSLMFRISKEFNYSDFEEWAKKTIIRALQLGKNIDSSLIDAISHSQIAYTQFIYSVCLMRCQKYSHANKILEELHQKYPFNREIKKLLAVCLNRCRIHDKADLLFEDLINTSVNNDEKTIILSFLLVNFIHDGKEEKAKQLVVSYNNSNELCESKFWGYFLRNAATLFEPEIAINYWESAIENFKKNNDNFGYYSTVCNMSRYYLRTNPKISQKKLEEAYEELLPFGIDKLHIVSNNLGIVSLYCNDDLIAEKYLTLAIHLSKTLMPKAYATMNMCYLLLTRNKLSEAQKLMQELMVSIEKSKLPRLKAKYYLTMSTLTYIAKDYEKAKEYLNKVEEYTSKFKRVRSELQSRVTNKIKFESEDWEKIFSPCFLEYWVVDPMSLLLDKTLPFETIDEDFFN